LSYSEIKIGNCCIPTEQTDPRRLPEKSFEYIDISSIDKDSKQIVSTTKIAGRDAPSRARKLVRQGDILVSTVRPNLNAVAIVPPELDGEIASTGFCVLRAKKNLLKERYLFYRTLTPHFINFLVANMRGANYPAVTDGVVKEAIVPLPPPKEQQRIVEILDQADELRRKRAEADSKAERIFPALFIKTFGDNNYPKYSLKQLAIDKRGAFVNGPFGSDLLTTELVSEGVPVIYIRDIRNGIYKRVSTVCITEEKAAQLEVTDVQSRDILIAKVGDPPGKAAIYPEGEPKAIVTQDVIRIKPNPSLVTSEYIVSLLNSPQGYELLKPIIIKGTRERFGLTQFKQILVPVPPLTLQERFAKNIQHLENLRSQRSKVANHIDSLFITLLHRAFSGELTAQWREAHLNELLEEMEIQRRELDLTDTRAARLF
jgi:type I restriction enzyme, S subunit